MWANLELKQGEQVLGTLKPYECDMPWVNCKFEPTTDFAPFKPLFDTELRLLDTAADDDWAEAYDKIADLDLRLVPVDGGAAIKEFLLHVQDDEAWFRY